MVDAVRALSQEEKDAKKKQAMDRIINDSVEDLQKESETRTLE